MKVHVVKDKEGKVVASFERKPGGAQLEPKIDPAHKVEEMELPDSYAANLRVLYKK